MIDSVDSTFFVTSLRPTVICSSVVYLENRLHLSAPIHEHHFFHTSVKYENDSTVTSFLRMEKYHSETLTLHFSSLRSGDMPLHYLQSFLQLKTPVFEKDYDRIGFYILHQVRMMNAPGRRISVVLSVWMLCISNLHIGVPIPILFLTNTNCRACGWSSRNITGCCGTESGWMTSEFMSVVAAKVL